METSTLANSIARGLYLRLPKEILAKNLRKACKFLRKDGVPKRDLRMARKPLKTFFEHPVAEREKLQILFKNLILEVGKSIDTAPVTVHYICPRCGTNCKLSEDGRDYHCPECGSNFQAQAPAITDTNPAPAPTLEMPPKQQTTLANFLEDQTLREILLGQDQSGDPHGWSGYSNSPPGGLVGKMKLLTNDRTVTFRAMRSTDHYLMGLQSNTWTTTFKARAWTQLFTGISPPVAMTIPPGIGVLIAGWFADTDLGGGTLRCQLNGMVRNEIPATIVYAARAYRTLDQSIFFYPNDLLLLEGYNPTSKDIVGTIIPMAVVVGYAAQLGMEPPITRE